MKKNWTTRVAVALLALTMITSCFVGSTFAKYVTKAQGEDNARVAKWGILISVEGGIFGTEYVTHDTEGYEGEFSVVSSNEDKVVAPGTSSDDLDDTIVATVSGTPEVATRYAIEGTVTDVVLPAGEGYVDYTNYYYNDAEHDDGYTGTFDLDKDYAPVKWNLVIEGKGQTLDVAEALYDHLPEQYLTIAEGYGLTREGCSFFDTVAIIEKVAGNETYTQIVEAALAEVVSGGSNLKLEANKEEGTFMLSYDFDPNKEMDFTFTLSWEWAFEQENVELFDMADTYLGNIAAGVVELPDGASITISANVVASATQID